MERHFEQKSRLIMNGRDFYEAGQDFIISGRDFHDNRLRFSW